MSFVSSKNKAQFQRVKERSQRIALEEEFSDLGVKKKLNF